MGKLKTKILGYKHDFVVFKNNLKKSEDFKSFLGMLGEIIMYSILGGLVFLVFTDVHILIKFLGIGSGLWLFQERVLGWIMNILGSFTLVKNYR